MTRRTTVALCAMTAIAIVVILVLWVVPGFLASNPYCPIHATANDRPLCAESVPLVEHRCNGEFCSNTPPTFLFQDVTFSLLLVNLSGTPAVDGWVTEPNNATFKFGWVGDPLGPSSLNWTSPDQKVFVGWQEPFATLGADGLLYANVTIGVSFALVNEW